MCRYAYVCCHSCDTLKYDDVIKWKHSRVTGALCGEFTGHWWIPLTKACDAEALIFSSICAWINGWVNHREAGDLRRHRTHYDVIVMCNLGAYDRVIFMRKHSVLSFYITRSFSIIVHIPHGPIPSLFFLLHAICFIVRLDTKLACTLRWRHNERDSVSNHQPHGCLLNGLLRRTSKKTSKLRVTGLCVGNSPGPVNSPHKGPVTRKMFPFDDVIMSYCYICWTEPTVNTVHSALINIVLKGVETTSSINQHRARVVHNWLYFSCQHKAIFEFSANSLQKFSVVCYSRSTMGDLTDEKTENFYSLNLSLSFAELGISRFLWFLESHCLSYYRTLYNGLIAWHSVDHFR